MKLGQLLEGKVLAVKIQEEIVAAVQDLKSKGKNLKLAALHTGVDASGEWYINQQMKLAQKLGILFEKITVPQNEKMILERVDQCNQDKDTHGVFIEQPFPQGVQADKVILSLNAQKDVEGIHPVSLGLMVLRKVKLIPPTAFAAFRLIEASGIPLRGKRAVILGQSAIVGRPLAMLLGEQRVTVTVCNTGTTETDLRQNVSESDLVVSCAGQPGIVKGNWIKEGAVVIDVGTTEVNGKLVGDVEFESAKARASFITPVPGGVGPLTVTMLMQNLIQAYQWQKNL